jgi:hypothetical protein
MGLNIYFAFVKKNHFNARLTTEMARAPGDVKAGLAAGVRVG